jgi:hypothetical protein
MLFVNKPQEVEVTRTAAQGGSGESAAQTVTQTPGTFRFDQWSLQLLGFLGGAAVGIAVVVFVERKKSSMGEEPDLTRLTGIPVLVSIPKISGGEHVERRS